MAVIRKKSATIRKSAKKQPAISSKGKVAKKKTGLSPGKSAPARKAPGTKSATGRRDFPPDFLWGSATAATQIDGGDTASDWYEFCQTPANILDGSSCATACDHWNRYESDYKLMKSLNFNAYRLGVDWSRFEPVPGQFDHRALDHFRGMLDSLRQKKIKPLLTLSHFTIPAWWLARGGWTRSENLEAFYNFVEFIVSGVCDLVDEYITINEPNVYALIAYLMGDWPPAQGGFKGLINNRAVMRHMVQAHFQMYDLIRTIHVRKNKSEPTTGLAMHIQLLDPLRPGNRLDENRAAAADYQFNRVFTDCIHSGKLLGPLGKGEKIHDGHAWDFFGLNYYSRRFVTFDLFAPHRLFIKQVVNESAPKNDLQWEIYPEGLYRTLKDVYARYNLPIRITENGIADHTDVMRGAFIKDHLAAMKQAMDEGVPVEGYYHWSFMDNFEWAEGYVPRFGLVEVDYVSQKRTVRPSARFLEKIMRSGRLN